MRPAPRRGGWPVPLVGLLLPVVLAAGAGAQEDRHTLSGYVEDAASGEKLIGAVLHEPDLRQGTTTNRYGFFSLTLPAGSLRVVVSHIGYQGDTLATQLDGDLQVLHISGTYYEWLKRARLHDDTRESVLAEPLSVPPAFGQGAVSGSNTARTDLWRRSPPLTLVRGSRRGRFAKGKGCGNPWRWYRVAPDQGEQGPVRGREPKDVP